MNISDQELLAEQLVNEINRYIYYQPANRLARSVVWSVPITASVVAIVGLCVGLFFLTQCLYKKYRKCKLKKQLLDQEVVV